MKIQKCFQWCILSDLFRYLIFNSLDGSTKTLWYIQSFYFLYAYFTSKAIYLSLREIKLRFQNGVLCSFCAGRRQILLTFFSNGGKFDGHSEQFIGQIDWRKLKDASKDTCYWSKLSIRRSLFSGVDFDRYAGIFRWESVVYAFVIPFFSRHYLFFIYLFF